MDTLNKMLDIASVAHRYQVDKAGVPYLYHPLSLVAKMMADGITDQELLIIALGHDVVEDSNYTIQDLSLIGFSERVLRAIECLTRLDTESTADYYERVKANRDALLIKIYDASHNADISRFPEEKRELSGTISACEYYQRKADMLKESLKKIKQ